MKKILIFYLFLFLFSCSGNDNHLPSTKNSEQVARVGNMSITKADVLRRIRAIPQDASSLYSGKKGLNLMLEEMIKAELLYLQATSEGLDNDPSFLEKLDDFRKLMLANMVLEKITSRVPSVTDKEAKAFYDRNKKTFSSQEVRARHILVETEAVAKNVITALKSGTGFGKAAKKWSIDHESARKGGDIGYFRRNEMLPEFEKAAFSLNKGEISDPIHTRAGYHIIKITDIRPGKIIPFVAAKGQIIDQLRREREKQAFDSYIEELKTRFPVDINLEKLGEIAASGSKD